MAELGNDQLFPVDEVLKVKLMQLRDLYPADYGDLDDQAILRELVRDEHARVFDAPAQASE